ncbi:Neurogenic locus delta isoform 2 [Schistosoma japonicum]|uniref:Neurogenic locus delta isoform 2 n=1 Tax=Schistosoma japonicum TaxID=6182 RepID=A0A4Z2CWW1_SCHJA|nr:Neurogenic locus delta isoform 2 [Schistosoma japonicum]
MWISIAIVIQFLYSFVIADVNISYTIKNYQNPYNLDSRLRKCEALNVFGDHCDPFFHFTAYTSTQKWERRSTLRKEVGPFVNSKYIDQILEAYEIQPTLPDLIEIELDIQDSDIDEDQRIALFRRQIPLEGKGKHEFRMGVDVKVEAHIEITCTKDYYGKRCEVYCIPLHDLWTCDENTGVRICSKPCLHGKCVLTSISAICQCTSDWQGEFCQTPIKSEIISTILAPDIKTIHVAKPIQIDQSVNRNSRISTSSVTTPSKKMSTTTQSDSKNSEQKEINTNAETHSEFSEELVKIVQLKFDNLQNLRKNHLDADLSVSTLPIPTITTTDKVIVSDQFKKNEEMIKESDSVIHPSGHFFNNETRNYMILITRYHYFFGFFAFLMMTFSATAVII